MHIFLQNRRETDGLHFVAAVERAGAISRQADIVAALSLEVLKGTTRAFDSSKSLPTSMYLFPWFKRQNFRKAYVQKCVV